MLSIETNEGGYWCSSLSYRPGLGNMGEFPNSGTGREPMHRRSSQAYHHDDTEIVVAWDSRTQIYWSSYTVVLLSLTDLSRDMVNQLSTGRIRRVDTFSHCRESS